MRRQPRVLTLACLVTIYGAKMVHAMPDPPGPAVVAVARADHILVPPGVFAPKLLFPKGRVEFGVVEQLVDEAVASLAGLGGSAGWRTFVSPVDNVGIMVDAAAPAVQLATVEVIIGRLVDAGVQPDHICVFAADERTLFNAGFNVGHDGPGVRTYGAASEGYRGGMSRLVTGDLQVLINVAALKADADIGMAGCVANCLACVPEVERRRLRADAAALPSVAAHPAIRMKLRLNFLEAYLPVVDPQPKEPVTTQYCGLIVGADPVAVDTIGLQVLQACRDAYRQQPWPLTPEAIYLQAAQQEFRVGQADPSHITVRLTGPEDGSYLK